MKVTIAICTWNHSSSLRLTLETMRSLRVPQSVAWEILVVNNGCTDNTDQVILHSSRFLPIRGIREPKLGLSNARNAAVKAASGDFILWTDDDVLVDPGWMEGYIRAFERSPQATIFGGPIAPYFEGNPPKWLLAVWDKVSNAYAIRDLGPVEIPLSHDNLPFGANYAVSLPFHKPYAYSPALGRKGKGMMGYEESALITAMLNDGHTGIWVPESKVRHLIPLGKQKTKYLRLYFHGQGLYLAQKGEPMATPRLLGYPRWILRKAVHFELKYRLHRIISPPEVWVEALVRASTFWGQLRGSFKAG